MASRYINIVDKWLHLCLCAFIRSCINIFQDQFQKKNSKMSNIIETSFSQSTPLFPTYIRPQATSRFPTSRVTYKLCLMINITLSSSYMMLQYFSDEIGNVRKDDAIFTIRQIKLVRLSEGLRTIIIIFNTNTLIIDFGEEKKKFIKLCLLFILF